MIRKKINLPEYLDLLWLINVFQVNSVSLGINSDLFVSFLFCRVDNIVVKIKLEITQAVRDKYHVISPLSGN